MVPDVVGASVAMHVEIGSKECRARMLTKDSLYNLHDAPPNVVFVHCTAFAFALRLVS
jgi:hypothetical protein